MSRGRRTVLALALVGLVLPAATSVAPAVAAPALAAPAAHAAALTAPQRPGDGRFHAVPQPVRVVSGLGLGAHAKQTLHLGGRAGLPSSGLRAVAVTLSAPGSTGATEVYAGTGQHRPQAPSLVSARQPVSSFAILPVSSRGALTVWNGRHRVALTVTVTGWFSARTESGGAGLFDRLAGRRVSTVHLGSGRHAAVKVAGREDVPASGAAALLVRVTVSHATRAGTVGLGPTATAAAAARSLQYARGTTSDLAVVRLKAGRLVIANSGRKGASVALDAVGWFTDGHDASQFGDALQVSAHPRSLAASSAVANGGLELTTAGVGGIPAATSATPTSLVLWRTSLTRPTSSGAISVDPASASRSHIPARLVHRGQSSAGLMLAPADATDRSVVYTSSGSVRLTAEAYAWFAGGVVLAPGAHILTGPTLAAVSAVTPTQVTFTGEPDALADLAAGDTLVAGVSGATPVGLLRTVDSVDAQGTDTVVTTSAATLTDVILQGSMSAGTASAPPPVPKPSARTNRRTASGSCDASGSLLFGGLDVGCSATFGEGVWTVGVDAGASAALGLDVSIGFGLPPSIKATTTLDVSARAGATFTASEAKDLDEPFSLGERTLEPIEFPIGPVPVVIVPKVDAQLHVTGHLEATLSAHAEYSAGLTATCSNDGGCSTSSHNGGSGSGGYQTQLTATAKAAFEPKIEALLYDVAGVTATMSPYVNVDADSCVITLKSGVDLNVGVELTVLDETVASASATLPLVETQLAQLALRNCAIWSGTLNFKAHVNWANDLGGGLGVTRTSNGSSSMHVDDVGGVPPPFGGYTLSGSGSGVDTYTQTDHFCSPDGVSTNTQIYHWSGAVTRSGSGGPINVNITHGSGRTWFLDQMAGASAPGDEKSLYWTFPPPDNTCQQRTDLIPGLTWDLDVFHVFSPGETSADSNRLTFKLPKGANTSTGTASFPADGDLAAYTLKWSLTKTCLKGGTTCD